MIPVNVTTPIPGPKSLSMIEDMLSCISTAGYSGLFGLAIDHGQGMYLTDVDGNTYLDFLAGASAVSLGYNHTELINTYVRAAQKMQHCAFGYSPSEEAIELAKKLVEITPGDHKKLVMFGLTGSDSVDAAVKVSRRATGRPRIISFRAAYHGSTGFSLAANGFGSLQKGLFLGDQFSMVPFPTTPEQAEITLTVIEGLLKMGDVAAIITESIQGDGGNMVPPENFHRQLFELAHRYGTVFVVDEVQSGVGRSGEWWEIQTFGVTPDILCTAKAITSGYVPLSACIAREDLAVNLGKAQHLFTYSGHPPACAVARKVIDIIETQDLKRNARERGQQLKDGLQPLVEKYPSAREVRGRGLHIGFEVREDKTDQPLGGLFAFRCVEKGLYPGYFGESNNVIRLHPPLIIQPEEVEFAVEVLTSVVEEWECGQFPEGTIQRYRQYGVGLGEG